MALQHPIRSWTRLEVLPEPSEAAVAAAALRNEEAQLVVAAQLDRTDAVVDCPNHCPYPGSHGASEHC